MGTGQKSVTLEFTWGSTGTLGGGEGKLGLLLSRIQVCIFSVELPSISPGYPAVQELSRVMTVVQAAVSGLGRY